MKNFAVIENEMVVNVIAAENEEIAEQVTEKECVECDGSFWIGWTRLDDKWIAPPKPIEEIAE